MEEKIAQQQALEVTLVKSLLHNIPEYERVAPEEREALERIAAVVLKKDKAARDASAAAVQPVRHTIKVEAVQ